MLVFITQEEIDGIVDNRSFIRFYPLSKKEGLPFPLHLDLAWKCLLTISLVFTLIYGCKLRRIIISFILSPETKLGPINYLILMDQLNGALLAVSIVLRIMFIVSPTPLSSILGNQFCKFSNFTGALYIGGSYNWSCLIAVYRVLYIRCQNWMKTQIGVRNLLYLMIFVGTTQILLFASLFQNDERNSTMKLCSHLSIEDLAIMDTYKVIFTATSTYSTICIMSYFG